MYKALPIILELSMLRCNGNVCMRYIDFDITYAHKSPHNHSHWK